MAIELVVFDLDGTLVTAEIDFQAMRQAIRDLLVEHEFPMHVLPMNSTQDLLRSAFAYAGEKGLTPIEISKLRDEVYLEAVKFEWEGAKKAQLVSGAKEILQALQQYQVNIAILTNDNRAVAKYLLEKFELMEYVDLLITREEAPHMKPATEGLELILNHFDIPAEQTIFIGDSTIDIMTANKLGIRCIARCSKIRSEKELKAEGAIAVFSTLTPIISYLREQKLIDD
ncbi:MAG: HAD family hydrolase [Candidatus Thorarchaeota archaeon]